MEDGLVLNDATVSSIDDMFGLNPCCNGRWSSTAYATTKERRVAWS